MCLLKYSEKSNVGIEKTKTSIQDIQNIKKEAMEKAITYFKSALEKAKEGLKQSFPEIDQ